MMKVLSIFRLAIFVIIGITGTGARPQTRRPTNCNDLSPLRVRSDLAPVPRHPVKTSSNGVKIPKYNGSPIAQENVDQSSEDFGFDPNFTYAPFPEEDAIFSGEGRQPPLRRSQKSVTVQGPSQPFPWYLLGPNGFGNFNPFRPPGNNPGGDGGKQKVIYHLHKHYGDSTDSFAGPMFGDDTRKKVVKF